MTQETIQPHTAKIGSINVLRFAAALFVVFYHFSFEFFYRDLSYVNTPILRYLFQYGYLGVDLFFIISGFVISLSAENRSPYAFFKSRVGRLYPVFWASAIITSIFLFFGGSLIYSHLSLGRFMTSMTMFPSFFHADALDGVYWTLAVEAKFYAIIFLLLWSKQFKRLEQIAMPVALLTLIGGIVFPIGADSQITWIPNFIAGIIFYKIYKEGLTFPRIATLGITMATALMFTLRRIPYLSEGYGVPFKPWVISAYILFFFIAFLLISRGKLKVPNNSFINILGLLTYPLYLLHQQIGKILFAYSDLHHIPLPFSFVAITIFVFALSYAVHALFERRGKIILDKVLDKVTPSSLKRL